MLQSLGHQNSSIRFLHALLKYFQMDPARSEYRSRVMIKESCQFNIFSLKKSVRMCFQES